MPVRFWSHPCCDGTAIWRRVSECGDCGQRGAIVRWMLTGHEAEGRYEYTYGLKSRGPHRRMAEELLGGLRTRCNRCEGGGILTLDRGLAWCLCPRCEGTGGFWVVSDAEVAGARAAVLREYPKADARRDGFLTPNPSPLRGEGNQASGHMES